MALTEVGVRRLFRAGMWLKAADSLIEVLSGLAIAYVSHDGVVRLAGAISNAKLFGDPDDRIANWIERAADGFSTSSQHFAAWYLVSHGAIKLALVAGVLANRLWAYPVFIVAMLGFIAYQGYRLSHQFSLPMAAITVLDLIVLVLAWHEWGFVRRDRSAEDSRPH